MNEVVKKADWVIVREAEQLGNMVGMAGEIERERTVLNNELMNYFRKQCPNYTGCFDEDKAEDILYNINEYIQENNIDMYLLNFPISSGSDIYLLPITENLQLKVLVVDEYYGHGDYEKYVMANFFLINENTNEKDVDALISFVNQVMV